ncbi:MAG: 3-hydroxyisobutyrate dehydrogenase [Legionellaceae bacterium]|nr:3-hydroxyisobutyrate dehydrogenase [Legionellaceae bacterium]
MAHIGFVGLGNMGLPMAISLLKAGHKVMGFDREQAPMRVLQEAGGYLASTLQDAALNQDVVITMLQTGEQVESVCLGELGLFATMSPGTLLIDCSSIRVEASRAVHAEADRAKILMVDAPVSGGVAGATDARLTFMVGGSEQAFQKAKPILVHMGHSVLHMGEASSGAAGKICNNMILGVSMIAVSEAFLLAEKLGLSAQKFHELVSQASGQCWVTNNYLPVPGVLPDVPAEHDYKPGFTSAMMLKDLRLAEEAATHEGLHVGMGASARALYEDANEENRDLDFSSIIRFIRNSSIKKG